MERRRGASAGPVWPKGDRPAIGLASRWTAARVLRAGLRIGQAELARRAGVGRQWIIAFEQGEPTLEVAKVFRTLETLGFDLVVTPDDPPPRWMLRATAAEVGQMTLAAGRRTRRNTRRAQAREARLEENQVWGRVDLE